jgi:hypothetical protein
MRASRTAAVQLAFDEDSNILATGEPDPVTRWLAQWKPAVRPSLRSRHLADLS